MTLERVFDFLLTGFFWCGFVAFLVVPLLNKYRERQNPPKTAHTEWWVRSASLSTNFIDGEPDPLEHVLKEMMTDGYENWAIIGPIYVGERWSLPRVSVVAFKTEYR